MTFDQIVSDVCEQLSLTSAEAIARVGRRVNQRYKRVCTKVGLTALRRATNPFTTTTFTRDQTIPGEKVIAITIAGQTKHLDSISYGEMQERVPGTGNPTRWALKRQNATDSVIQFDSTFNTAVDLLVEVEETGTTLSGANEPRFPESFHEILVFGAKADELKKKEKLALAKDAESDFDRVLAELTYHIAVNGYKDLVSGSKQSRTAGGAGSSGSSSGGTVTHSTGALTAELVILGNGGNDIKPLGSAGTAGQILTSQGAGVAPQWAAPAAVNDTNVAFTDNTTGNASSTKHGYLPKSPADATQFLNGAVTPAYAQVKDSDLSTADVTTNDVTSTKHGFAPKTPADATKFLNGAATAAYALVKDSDLSTSDIATNDVSIIKHGFTPKAPNDVTKFLRGDASWAVPASSSPLVTQGRLTLSLGNPVTSADVTAATTLRFTPYGGNRISLYDGVGTWNLFNFTELSIAVPSTTNTMYDVWVYDNAGTPTLEVLAWTNDTTRATALALQDGVYVKSGATTRKYVGSFRTTGVLGQTEDSKAKRYVWNYYNRTRRILRVDGSGNWNYTTATFRQANASSANQVDVVVGVAGEAAIAVFVDVLFSNTSTGSTVFASTGIGEDSTSAVASGCHNTTVNQYTSGDINQLHASLHTFPVAGRHFYAWLEYSAAVGTTTFYGSTATSTSGLGGWIDG